MVFGVITFVPFVPAVIRKLHTGKVFTGLSCFVFHFPR